MTNQLIINIIVPAEIYLLLKSIATFSQLFNIIFFIDNLGTCHRLLIMFKYYY